jgi:crossover junction endodeoxyribonuclease RusA
MSNSVDLPWYPRELSPNSRCHWRVKARVGKDYKELVYYECKFADLKLINPGDEKVHLSVNFYPPSRHIFDQDNCIASCKQMMDSIAEYLHVNDRNFIYHWVYHCYQDEYKGEIHVEIIPDPNI